MSKYKKLSNIVRYKQLDFNLILLFLIRKMHTIVFINIILVLLVSISGAPAVRDDRVIIGSSIGGIIGLIILILDLIAIFELLTSGGRGILSKLIWILIILFFPIGGLILYWCCGRRRAVDQAL
ncbi:unnamed protein product [Rotaria sordida]|uniref:Cardiolipin synthase N-terminal domain-containing protein n=2 Tax=Rotaria sordida TaxID=392033 RepID=A0A814CTE2_9BILA|nr:unnamed protein product [Rotaria sordida]CAF0859612.1 unnamed protein product [Rotaria sordida]CAF0866426.1 unnamed protein product [Rotaria sordida]CAF0944547.1 unnamed protein product [Rotaria sordida]